MCVILLQCACYTLSHIVYLSCSGYKAHLHQQDFAPPVTPHALSPETSFLLSPQNLPSSPPRGKHTTLNPTIQSSSSGPPPQPAEACLPARSPQTPPQHQACLTAPTPPTPRRIPHPCSFSSNDGPSSNSKSRSTSEKRPRTRLTFAPRLLPLRLPTLAPCRAHARPPPRWHLHPCPASSLDSFRCLT